MPVVAIDGPAGAGKSSVARRVAAALGWAYLDSGALYRAVTLRALRQGIDLGDVDALAALARQVDLLLERDGSVRMDGEDVTRHLRTPQVTAAVSVVASVAAVRQVMVAHQRRFAQGNPRVVAEGRDMGTVVFPDAELKIYLDAQPQERARRRMAQVEEVAAGADQEAVRAGLEARDRLDSTREVAPLQQAADAWRLDTTGMTLDEVVEAVGARVRSAIRP